MSLLAQIKSDQLAARKARNSVVASSLTTLIGDIEKKQKDQGSVTDAEVVAIVKKHVQGVSDNIALVSGEQKVVDFNIELHALNMYIPIQMTGFALQSHIAAIMQEPGNDKQGPIMKALKDRFAGQYDGKEASELIKKMIGVV